MQKHNPPIPTFFSRLYETQYSFFNVLEIADKEGYCGLDGSSVYHQAVSETLDVMEFIFRYGDSVKVLTFDKAEIVSLKCSQAAEHQFIVNIIEKDWGSDELLSSEEQFFLFTYNNTCIGGSSPLTIVYPSSSVSISSNSSYRGNLGNYLFRKIVPLHKRGEDFIEFMVSLAINHQLPDVIREYIKVSCPTEWENLQKSDDTILSICEGLLTTTGMPVRVGNFPLLKLSKDKVADRSGYLIRPTTDISFQDSKQPLVLSSRGIDGAIYLGKSKWKADYLFEFLSTCPIEQRLLPGTSARYPFLYIDDFLEEYLIEISKNCDTERFDTLSTLDRTFLLPLKPLFFKYFRKEDIHNFLAIKEIGDEHITVTLNIPVAAGVVNFTKSYGPNDITNLRREVNLAVIPFYKLPNEHYTVLSSLGKEAELEFINSCAGDYIEKTSSDENCEERFVSIKTHADWDLIEVKLCECRGLLIPKFTEVINNNAIAPTPIFNVSIGDALTTITHQSNAGGVPIHLQLGKSDNFVGLLIDNPYTDPLLVYFDIPQYNQEKDFPYYIPTKLYKSYCKDISLFNGAAIKFDIQNVFPRQQLVSNLLSHLNYYSIEDRDMLVIYCQELLLFIKTKSLMSYYTTNFVLNIALPVWMKTIERKRYKGLWLEIFQDSGFDTKNLHFVEEDVAIADYHIACLHSKSLAVHIDEKHIDIVYNNIHENIFKSLSIPFGLHNIYEPCSHFFTQSTTVSNPFIQRLLQRIIFDDNIRYKLYHMLDSYASTCDIVCWCMDNGMSSELDVDELFKNTKILFFTMLTLYISDFLNKYDINNPHDIVFSGIGAKVMQVDKDREIIIKLLREHNHEIYSVHVLADYANYVPINFTHGIINVEKCWVYGLDDETPGMLINPEEVMGYQTQIIDRIYRNLNQHSTKNIINNYAHLQIDRESLDSLKEGSKHNYEASYLCHSSHMDADEFKEPIFFWALRDLFYQYAQGFNETTN